MNDLITAATSGLFVEVGKVIEHMKAQASRIADLERQLAEASAPAVERQQWSHITPRDFVEVATAIMDQHGLMDGLSYEKTEKLCEAMEESFKKLPHPAPQAADTDKVREAILSILPNPPASLDKHESASYCVDFRAGLKAAAELVGSMAAQAPVREVPEGWQLVPVEPTEEMLKAIVGGADSPGSFLAAAIYYQKVLAASPLPAAPVRQEIDL